MSKPIIIFNQRKQKRTGVEKITNKMQQFIINKNSSSNFWYNNRINSFTFLYHTNHFTSIATQVKRSVSIVSTRNRVQQYFNA